MTSLGAGLFPRPVFFKLFSDQVSFIYISRFNFIMQFILLTNTFSILYCSLFYLYISYKFLCCSLIVYIYLFFSIVYYNLFYLHRLFSILYCQSVLFNTLSVLYYRLLYLYSMSVLWCALFTYTFHEVPLTHFAYIYFS